MDIRPFKLALVTCVRRWSYAFKKHLTEHVVNSLSELNSFIDKADEGLMTSTEEGDYDGLVMVMEFLRMVNKRQATADVMFEPLRGIINMLRSYGVVIPEESMVQLNELPEKWANTKRLSVQAKQQVSPLQSLEVGKLKNRISDFDKKQVIFKIPRVSQTRSATFLKAEHPWTHTVSNQWRLIVMTLTSPRHPVPNVVLGPQYFLPFARRPTRRCGTIIRTQFLKGRPRRVCRRQICGQYSRK